MHHNIAQDYYTPDVVTPNVTAYTFSFNPYLPAAGKVLQVLSELAPVGTTIFVRNRHLAVAVDCSAGAMPPILRLLEADGHITRKTTPRGSFIVVISQRSTMNDRCEASESDHAHDRSEATTSPNDPRTQAQEWPAKRAPRAISHADPPLHPPTWNHVMQQQQHGRNRQKTFQDAQNRPPNIPPNIWQEMLENTPGYTAAKYAADVQSAVDRGGIRNPIGFVIELRRQGAPIYTRAEIEERASAASPQSAQRAPSPRPERRRGGRRAAHEDGIIPVKQFSPEELAAHEALTKRALGIAPDPNDQLAYCYLMEYLEAGASDEEALAQLKQQQERDAVRDAEIAKTRIIASAQLNQPSRRPAWAR